MHAGLLLLLALSSGLDALTVQGAVHDVVSGDADPALGVWLSRTRDGARELIRTDGRKLLGAPARVPTAAVNVDGCAGFGLVFQDADGLIDATGRRLLRGDALFRQPDPETLHRAQLCEGAELRLVVRAGVLVRAGETTTLLPFSHRARAYSGDAHRGLRPSRPYGAALSLYAPRMIDVDVDGDGANDLVLVHEARLKVFFRRGGALTAEGAVERDLAAVLGVPADEDVRVLLADVDGDRRAELFVGTSKGPVPERSTGWRVRSRRSAFDGKPKRLWRRDGFSAPLGVHSTGLVLAHVDTSVVALGAAILTGEVPVTVRTESGEDEVELVAVGELRSGRMAGAMPIVDVDFTGDGRADLLDLGVPERAAVHPGSARGFSSSAVRTFEVPRFVHVVRLHTPGVALIAEPARDSRGRTTTRVAFIQPDETRARLRSRERRAR